MLTCKQPVRFGGKDDMKGVTGMRFRFSFRVFAFTFALSALAVAAGYYHSLGLRFDGA